MRRAAVADRGAARGPRRLYRPRLCRGAGGTGHPVGRGPGRTGGNRVCGTGTVQTLTQVQPKPAQYEGTLLTKTNETISFGAVGDATGIKQGGPATFCGVASGVLTISTTRAIREVGMFDTPINRGATGGGGNSLAACCAALRQNSASMPPPQNMYAMAAAQYCSAAAAAVANPAQKDATINAIRGMLKGAAMPGSCR